MNNFPLVNIVIITTDQFAFIGECLGSILDSKYKNIQIFMVYNNSDLSKYQDFYKTYKHFKKIKFLRLTKRTGFGGACNYALKKIKKGYVVLLNDDTIVSKNWLNPIINYMEKHPEVGACQPKIRSMRNKAYFEYAGAGGGFMDVYGYPFCRGRIFYTIEKDNGQYDDIVDVVWTSGNCLITKMG
ncbi:MAG: glycosyltransferase [Patescibacteria group bacterium]|nr:glycosyltransferase [Patescibacteria group bacterium]